MKVLRILVCLVLIGSSLQLKAWDEVTHAYMTQMIPELVKNSELKRLLQDNLEEYTYGSWYTDTYQYTDDKTKRVDYLNPHYINTYGKAFMKYLQKEEVKQQANYEKLVALYLGSLSHLLEDFWYDSNLNIYQKTKNDKYKGDAKHGAFIAKQYGYINLKVNRYFPKHDLFNMYKEAEMLQEEYDTVEEFGSLIDSWSNQQYLLLRSLKLINFVAGNQMRNESLWTAGNLMDIEGGMKNCAEVAAKFIEAKWNELQGNNAPRVLYANYFEYENKVAILTSFPTQILKLNKEDIFLISNSNETLKGSLRRYEHQDKKKGITKYAFAFHPTKKLTRGETYQLKIDPGSLTSDHFIYSFQPGSYIEKQAQPKPFLSTIGLGIFGFIPLLGISGLIFGISGILRFNWDYKNEDTKLPVSRNILRRALQTISLFILFFGFYMLATRGSIIIDMAL